MGWETAERIGEDNKCCNITENDDNFETLLWPSKILLFFLVISVWAVRQLLPALEALALCFLRCWCSGWGAEPHLQDGSQKDRDSRQDEDDDTSHSLFPGGEEYAVRGNREILSDQPPTPLCALRFMYMSKGLQHRVLPCSLRPF